MTEVNPNISEGFLAEFTAEGPTWSYLRVVKLHVGTQAARVSICFTANWANVGPAVGVTVHVALEVMLKLETAAAGRATVEWTTAYEHSWMGGTSQVKGYWGWLGRTVQDLCCGSCWELMSEYKLLFLAIWGNGGQAN